MLEESCAAHAHASHFSAPTSRPQARSNPRTPTAAKAYSDRTMGTPKFDPARGIRAGDRRKAGPTVVRSGEPQSLTFTSPPPKKIDSREKKTDFLLNTMPREKKNTDFEVVRSWGSR